MVGLDRWARNAFKLSLFHRRGFTCEDRLTPATDLLRSSLVKPLQ
jgi:hypothetical protein